VGRFRPHFFACYSYVTTLVCVFLVPTVACVSVGWRARANSVCGLKKSVLYWNMKNHVKGKFSYLFFFLMGVSEVSLAGLCTEIL